MTRLLLDKTDRSRLAKHVMNLCNEGVIITNATSTILDVNPAMCAITGYKRNQIIGQTPRMFQSGFHDKTFYKNMWKNLKKTNSWQGEIWDRKQSGEATPRYLRIKAIRNEHGKITNYVGMMQDNSQLVALAQLANKDPLTELPNRRLFDERLNQSVAHSKRTGKPFALLYVDLDDFKKINDTQGHLVGDKVLQCVSTRLSQVVREEDTVARIGGDEFAVILPEIKSDSDINQVCEKITKKLRQNYIIGGETHNIGCSIGYSMYPNQTDNVTKLIHLADQAMYISKNRSHS